MTPAATRAPAVSVLLPVYNGGVFLEPALESIRAQTFTDFECLVLDDGSTDGSGDVAQRIANRDVRFRVIRRENRGLVATLNELLGEARGELIARMDADDVALPDRFARQVEFMAANPQVVCLGGGQILMDERGRPIAPIEPPVDDRAIQESALRGHGSICHPTAMIRASALQALGGYRPAFYPAEDLDLWLRLGELGELANLAEPVIFYRVHSGSISGAAAGGRQREAGRRACADAWQRRGRGDVVYEAGAAWRPDSDVDSRYRFVVDYGWRAYFAGFRATSRAYAVKAIRLRPWRQAGWRLLVKAVATSKARGFLA
jgi:glycosyltransferase involved in cell wall biosynthesis